MVDKHFIFLSFDRSLQLRSVFSFRQHLRRSMPGPATFHCCTITRYLPDDLMQTTEMGLSFRRNGSRTLSLRSLWKRELVSFFPLVSLAHIRKFRSCYYKADLITIGQVLWQCYFTHWQQQVAKQITTVISRWKKTQLRKEISGSTAKKIWWHRHLSREVLLD